MKLTVAFRNFQCLKMSKKNQHMKMKLWKKFMLPTAFNLHTDIPTKFHKTATCSTAISGEPKDNVLTKHTVSRPQRTHNSYEGITMDYK